MKKLILGPPGTGKTTTLLNIVDEYLSQGMKPQRIAFVTFTKSGAEEAINRAAEKFGKPKTHFPHFKTLHAVAYRDTGARSVMGWKDYRELSEDLGYKVTGDDDENAPMTDGQVIKHVEEQARTRCITMEDAALQLAPNLNPYQIVHYHQTLEKFKEVHGVPDFTDLINRFISADVPLDVDVVIVDEAQDLTELQWRMVEVLARNATDVYYAGDDDQTVHVWAGACINRFMALGERCDDIEVLGHSYRLPAPVHEYANGLSDRISSRYKKEWEPNDHYGEVRRVSHSGMIKLPVSKGEWMFLARNKRGLESVEDVLRKRSVLFMKNGKPYLGSLISLIKVWEALRKGVPQTFKDVSRLYDQCFFRMVQRGNMKFKGAKGMTYSMDDLHEDFGLTTREPWFDAFDKIPLADREYLQSCLRAGERSPRINIMTIHASKGREADNVVLLSDCSKASVDELYRQPDSEHRVFYVGATRAKQTLWLVHESQENFYPL